MLEGFSRRGDVYYPPGEPADTRPGEDRYRTLWDREADEDAVYSATGIASHGREDYQTLTGTRQRLWREFPGRHLGTILEIGCGYGRVPMLLSRERGVTCDRYLGVDISQSMLARFARYRSRYDVFPGSDLYLVCCSAEKLPLPESSVDLVISSAVFLHMGKQYVRSTHELIGRVLKPGGDLVIDTSFPNSHCIGHLPARVFGWFAPHKPNRGRYWSRGELTRLMHDTGVAAKCGSFTIEATDFALFPDRIRKLHVPLARSINRRLTPPPRALEDVLAMMFSVFSPVVPPRGGVSP
jgi:SAM-dependent methyltransferase